MYRLLAIVDSESSSVLRQLRHRRFKLTSG